MEEIDWAQFIAAAIEATEGLNLMTAKEAFEVMANTSEALANARAFHQPPFRNPDNAEQNRGKRDAREAKRRKVA